MKLKQLAPLFLILLAGCGPLPMDDSQMASSLADGFSAKLASYRAPASLEDYVKRLMTEGRDWRMHGIYIESLDTEEPIAMLNESAEFNPASVTKLATTLAALDRLGREHRFRTEFRTDGDFDSATGDLYGNLILIGGGDPSFSLADARKVGDALRRLGVRRVRGGLLVVGDFICNENSDPQVSARVFRRNVGVSIVNQTRITGFENLAPSSRFLAAVESDTLLDIVHYLNAHSVNSMAEMLGTHVGGPQGVQNFLVQKVGVPAQSIHISYASGLEVNRITPRDTVKMLRSMIQWLSANNLDPGSVMAVAGIDAGTLRGRFGDGRFAGSVVAKTGTLYSTDDGVAALAGIMYTRDRGPLLFAVYDMAEGRNVPHLRRIQDEFIRKIIKECGGPQPLISRAMRNATERPESRLVMGV